MFRLLLLVSLAALSGLSVCFETRGEREQMMMNGTSGHGQTIRITTLDQLVHCRVKRRGPEKLPKLAK